LGASAHASPKPKSDLSELVRVKVPSSALELPREALARAEIIKKLLEDAWVQPLGEARQG